MNHKVCLLLGLLASLVLCAACSGSGNDQDGEKARNIILFIGDGMGGAHREAIRLSTAGFEGSLSMDALRYSGLSRTGSADDEDFVTDSAAAATAIASGVKTHNGAVGVGTDGEQVTTVLEEAIQHGKATGLVTTSQVTDATPAAFAAHVPDRGDQSEIARQYIEESRPDVILGGGEDFWYPEGDPGAYPDRQPEDPEEESRGSEGDLAHQAERSGYKYIADPDELEDAEGTKILGLFANEEMFQDGTEGEAVYDPVVPLPAMTSKAIEVLSKDEEGFILVVEEEAIDAMSHENNAELVLEAGQQFDEAVSVARSYAKNHPETLLIVTADHETGGLAVEGAHEAGVYPVDGPFGVVDSDQEFAVGWSTEGHTAVPVPVTAEGPGADRLVGTYENTHVHDVMKKALLGEGKE
jgi:alkaline phosphatase